MSIAPDRLLRSCVLKHIKGWSFRVLEREIRSSLVYRRFTRFDDDSIPNYSTFSRNFSLLGDAFVEKIHARVVAQARDEKVATGRKLRTDTTVVESNIHYPTDSSLLADGIRVLTLVSVAEKTAIEKGRKVRVDCTVVESNIHSPTDSELLYDCVRVLTRLMCRTRELLGTVVVFGNRTRRAKRRRLGVLNAKDKEQRRRVYRDLLKVSEETYRSAQRVADQLDESGLTEPVKRASAEKIAADFKHFLVLTEKVINQTRRRVIDEERVPAEEKVVSIFEEHTDIIRKDRRETLYGHKVCLTGGSSSMILDCVILDGNPSDSTLAETMIDRQVELYERAPRQVAYDGAFSSKANLEAIKGKGVEDVAFTKAHFAVTDMVKSSWVCLRRFRCGIEGVISFLKRVFGLDRCTWRSLPSFKSYVWSSIITCNLLVMARHLLR